MAERQTAERRIRAAARKRDEAEAAKAEATAELRNQCAEGRAVGLSVSEIARFAGLSRQAVYDFLQRK